jgi:hypothetical protein
LASTAAAAAPAGTDEVAAAHARLVADKSLQFDMSGVTQPPPPDLKWLEDIGKLLDSMIPAFKVIVWLGLAAGAGVVIFLIAREVARVRWPERFGAKLLTEAQGPWRPTDAEAVALLEDADRLAAEGRFEEAVRLILHRSVQDIQGRRPRLLTPALTSRDIAGLPELPPAARTAFTSIAQVVERAVFAGRPVGAEGFAECRRTYEAFAFPGVWA